MRILRTVSLKVNLFAGSNIQEACIDIVELSGRLGCLVEANFSGVTLQAHGNDNPYVLASRFDIERKSENKFKIARC